jgi:hypothetical protein
MTAIHGKTSARITDGNSPWNEAFSFSPEEYGRLKISRPDLFDPDLSPQDKARLWKEFGQSSIGRVFRWR